MRAVTLFLAALIVIPMAVAQNAPAASSPKYEVLAIRFGSVPGFGLSNLIKGAGADEKIDIAMYVWLIRGGGRNILVDSGFSRPDYVTKWKVSEFVRPDEAVSRAGVKPDEVTDVIVTHMHWDHAGSVDLFPKAQVWLQRDEYVYYTADAWQSGGKHGGVDPIDLATMLRVNTEGRLHLVDGDREILPGIRVFTGGRHTWASQYVAVDARPGTVVLASDNMYLYANLDKHLPIAQTFDEASNLRAQDQMRQLVTDAVHHSRP